jgi:hypothetical protein
VDKNTTTKNHNPYYFFEENIIYFKLKTLKIGSNIAEIGKCTGIPPMKKKM